MLRLLVSTLPRYALFSDKFQDKHFFIVVTDARRRRHSNRRLQSARLGTAIIVEVE